MSYHHAPDTSYTGTSRPAQINTIYFKFKSTPNGLSWGRICVEGNVITLLSLKRAIMQLMLAHNHISSAEGFDLMVKNINTGEDYREDGFCLYRNTSVIIRRIPAALEKTTKILESSTEDGHKILQQQCILPGQQQQQQPVMEHTTDSEDAGVLAILSQTQVANKRERECLPPQKLTAQSRPPPRYICHRCKQGGHYIRFCPTNGDPAFDNVTKTIRTTIKPGTTPILSSTYGSTQRTFLQPIEDPKGVMAREERGLGDIHEFEQKTSSNIIITSTTTNNDYDSTAVDAQINSHKLICPLCADFFKNAVVVPCCWQSFCNNCIRTALETSTSGSTCPLCHASFTYDQLMLNLVLQRTTDNYVAMHPNANSYQLLDQPQPSSPHTTTATQHENIDTTDPFFQVVESPSQKRKYPPDTTPTPVSTPTFNAVPPFVGQPIPTYEGDDDDDTAYYHRYPAKRVHTWNTVPHFHQQYQQQQQHAYSLYASQSQQMYGR